MSDQPTTTLDSASWESLAGPAPRGMAVVILWLRGELSRVGEVAFLPQDGRPVVIGRGGGPGKLQFFGMRPGVAPEPRPLEAPRLSREQLELRLDEQGVGVRMLGRGELIHGERVVRAHTARAGELIEVRNQLLLLVGPHPRGLDSARPRRASLHPWGQPDPHGLVGESPAAWALRDDLAFLGPRSGHVLVLGASGTGKELASRAIHALSPRASGPFVGRNAATLPPSLVDAELFGHARDYPNAGMEARPGLVGESHGGTLFLDEIGELGSEAQTRLLRVLDGGEYHRLGESRARYSDLRVVAATNQPLTSLRPDLAARFTQRLEMPPLDERPADVPLLLLHLLDQARGEPDLQRQLFDSTGEPRVATALVAQLVLRPWTTHVRELHQLLWEAIRLSRGRHLAPLDRLARPTGPRPAVTETVDPDSLEDAALREALEVHQGNITAAAEALGLSSRYALYRLLKRRGLR